MQSNKDKVIAESEVFKMSEIKVKDKEIAVPGDTLAVGSHDAHA